MLIDREQLKRIFELIERSGTYSNLDFWHESEVKFLSKYKASFGDEVKTYNPFVWRRELIFNTEQDAVLFVLKVL